MCVPPPMSVIVRNWLTPPPPSVSDCQHMADAPTSLCKQLSFVLQKKAQHMFYNKLNQTIVVVVVIWAYNWHIKLDPPLSLIISICLTPLPPFVRNCHNFSYPFGR